LQSLVHRTVHPGFNLLITDQSSGSTYLLC
jgi:hypothetical protein